MAAVAARSPEVPAGGGTTGGPVSGCCQSCHAGRRKPTAMKSAAFWAFSCPSHSPSYPLVVFSPVTCNAGQRVREGLVGRGAAGAAVPAQLPDSPHLLHWPAAAPCACPLLTFPDQTTAVCQLACSNTRRAVCAAPRAPACAMRAASCMAAPTSPSAACFTCDAGNAAEQMLTIAAGSRAIVSLEWHLESGSTHRVAGSLAEVLCRRPRSLLALGAAPASLPSGALEAQVGR